MKRLGWPGTIAAISIATLCVPAFAADVTVGRFYVEIARTKRLAANDAASAESTLRSAGYALPSLALDKGLTEGDMTSISKALGVAVTTRQPSHPISESQMSMFLAGFGSQLGAPAGGASQVQGTANVPVSDQFGNSPGKGKGKKKGHHKSDPDPI
jgi:hypothetical protein